MAKEIPLEAKEATPNLPSEEYEDGTDPKEGGIFGKDELSQDGTIGKSSDKSVLQPGNVIDPFADEEDDDSQQQDDEEQEEEKPKQKKTKEEDPEKNFDDMDEDSDEDGDSDDDEELPDDLPEVEEGAIIDGKRYSKNQLATAIKNNGHFEEETKRIAAHAEDVAANNEIMAINQDAVAALMEQLDEVYAGEKKKLEQQFAKARVHPEYTEEHGFKFTAEEKKIQDKIDDLDDFRTKLKNHKPSNKVNAEEFNDDVSKLHNNLRSPLVMYRGDVRDMVNSKQDVLKTARKVKAYFQSDFGMTPAMATQSLRGLDPRQFLSFAELIKHREASKNTTNKTAGKRNKGVTSTKKSTSRRGYKNDSPAVVARRKGEIDEYMKGEDPEVKMAYLDKGTKPEHLAHLLKG